MDKVKEQDFEDAKWLGALKGNLRMNTSGTDDDLAIDIQDAIGREGFLSLVADNIQVTVEDEMVTLAGEVNTQRERMTAGDLAATCAGENNVNNYLRVKNYGV